MGIASLGGILSGSGDVSSPKTKGVGNDYLGLLNSYLGSSGSIFSNQAKYQPQYEQLGISGLTNQAPQISGVLSSLAPQINSAVNAMTPGQSSLMASLNSQAQQGLDAGASLDPSLSRVATQSIRGGQAARGMGYGPADVLQESSALTQLGDSLRQERQQFAGNVAGYNNQFETMPSLQTLNTILAQYNANKAGAGPSLAPPSVTSNFLTMPYQGRLQANQATAANNTSLYQSMDSNSNSFISGL